MLKHLKIFESILASVYSAPLEHRYPWLYDFLSVIRNEEEFDHCGVQKHMKQLHDKVENSKGKVLSGAPAYIDVLRKQLLDNYWRDPEGFAMAVDYAIIDVLTLAKYTGLYAFCILGTTVYVYVKEPLPNEVRLLLHTELSKEFLLNVETSGTVVDPAVMRPYAKFCVNVRDTRIQVFPDAGKLAEGRVDTSDFDALNADERRSSYLVSEAYRSFIKKNGAARLRFGGALII